MFKKVRQHVREMSSWEIELVTEEDGTYMYKTTMRNNVQKFFYVSCILNSNEVDGVSCECRKMECEDIPCTHIFSVLKYLGLSSMPRCCINDRWTMDAKVAYISERNTSTHLRSDQMVYYRQLRNKSTEALFMASQNTDRWQMAMDFFQSILDEDIDNNGNNIDLTTFGPLPAHFSAANQSFEENVLDPVPIIPKGAPFNKRRKPFQEIMRTKTRKRLCTVCKDPNHDRRKFPKLKYCLLHHPNLNI
ncbi:hypothetical protein PR202_ga20621 [Eleusine coracana subsp. coracana]|uniref:Protein FAR1-RELATED SEQUENCE n=1 Tax=Eleusine coracana subsp. coracana TaxID=191504 RepID=A0AAV5CXW4_ELECO|nr:hypothetical protein PR202_ga20621 [Eleusine coracana subsp. coracana]